MHQTLHAPEGVRDIYGDECERKESLLLAAAKQMLLYGYRQIQTPTFEYDRMFDEDGSLVTPGELYRFFDREGRILTLRPDITPGVVRAAATVFHRDDFPVRLCYSGNIFCNHSDYQGRLREQTQFGAELLGAESVEADAEVIALLIDCLRKAGLSDFQVAVGHVDYLQGLVDDTKLAQKERRKLYKLIANKNYFGAVELLSAAGVRGSVIRSFEILPSLAGGTEIMELAAGAAGSIRSKLAIGRLLKIYKLLSSYGLDRYITFDLSMNGSYGYYTGIIFRAYTHGLGDALARGGRYDHMPEKFGLQAPAVGFAVTVDDLQAAMSRQRIKPPLSRLHLLVYEEEMAVSAIRMARQFRKKGRRVSLLRMAKEEDKEQYMAYARRCHALDVLFLHADKTLDMYNLNTGESIRRHI